MWTIYGCTEQDGKTVYQAGRNYETKREAVTAMMGARKPKTAIVRVGHIYTYIVAD